MISKIFLPVLKKFFGVEENKSRELGQPKKILVIRQHNQLGHLLAGVSLLRALKETYPDSHITLIVSPFNLPGMIKNSFIDELVVFDKKKLINPVYFNYIFKILREDYDVAIVPVVVSISFLSNLLARIVNAKIRIGAASLNGIKNNSYFFFDRRVELDWRNHPDSNSSERSLDIVRPFGINTNNYRAEINFNGKDAEIANNFIQSKFSVKKYLIGIHPGSPQPAKRWSLNNFKILIKKLKDNLNAEIYLTGTNADKEEIDYFRSVMKDEVGYFINRSIPEVAALISLSNLFISSDTGIMHVAGTTDTPQVSIFGPSNPFTWAPIGPNKYFIRKSDLIDDVTIDDVYHLCDIILNKKEVET